MPPTDSAKLRKVREMMAAEEAAKMQNDRTQCRAATIHKWRSAPAKSGNEAFFQLGVDLRSAGMSMAEVKDTLRLEAGNTRHPTERRRVIKNIM